MRPSLTRGVVQIAGIRDAAEAALLERCGVTLLGFPLRLPVNREDIGEEDAARIIRALAPPCLGVLITYLDDARDISDFCASLGARAVQLHGDLDAGQVAALRSIEPELLIIKSLVVGLHDEPSLASLIRDLSPLVDAFITDTYDPATGASGATGRRHDGAVSRRLVASSPRPVILAGGLTPENVRAAVTEVRPWGVDAHTGVEDDEGRKCPAKVARFVAEARAGFEMVAGDIPH